MNIFSLVAILVQITFNDGGKIIQFLGSFGGFIVTSTEFVTKRIALEKILHKQYLGYS